MCYVNSICQYYANRSPKKFVNIVHPLATIFVVAGISFFFSVQMFYIAPRVYKDMAYELYWLLAIFIMQNILGNWWACYRTSSSVESLPKDSQKPVPEEEHLWRFCESCKKLMPPRSWHCALCKCCILRRDHHCIFTATCIGHNNQRYFFWFAFYLTFGLVVSFVTFCLYLRTTGCNLFVLPDLYSNMILEFLCTHRNTTSGGSVFQTITYVLNVFALVIPGFMLAYQVQILWLNSSYYQVFDRVYDLGFLENCKLIMGQRGLWTFLTPWLKSPLPHDGTQWQMKPQSH
ncbi:uncharacterized protein LOC108026038 [Drosophila biarmipes]|uniref:uncharacterized protein LOC108026038 n=1 Tax=Drosophila biarmipes TaxID=125945 RepID=UPI0007E7D898|nr:uncharacterized protein LOC108026038 [Drosophila biarmipes]